jgi:hypothetical protein
MTQRRDANLDYIMGTVWGPERRQRNSAIFQPLIAASYTVLRHGVAFLSSPLDASLGGALNLEGALLARYTACVRELAARARSALPLYALFNEHAPVVLQGRHLASRHQEAIVGYQGDVGERFFLETQALMGLAVEIRQHNESLEAARRAAPRAAAAPRAQDNPFTLPLRRAQAGELQRAREAIAGAP